MKRILGVLALTMSLSAFANDSGAYLIDVKGVNPANGQSGANYISAKDGSGFTFRGPGAVNLHKRLPPVSLTTVPERGNLDRALHIISGGWQLILGCKTATFDEETGKPVEKWEDYAECEFVLWSLREIGSPEGHDFSSLKDSDYKVAEIDRSVEKIHVDLIDATRKPQERFDDLPTAKSGTKITFYGKDTEQFFKLLADSKKLTIAGKGKPADGMDNKLVISCVDDKDPVKDSCSIEYTETQR